MSTLNTKMSSPLPTRTVRRTAQPKLLFVAVPIVLLCAGAGIALSRPAGESRTQTSNASQVTKPTAQGTPETKTPVSEETKRKLVALADEWKKTPVRLQFAPETGIKRTYTPPAEKLGLSVDIPATLKAMSDKLENAGTMTRLAGFFGRGQNTELVPIPTVDIVRLHAYLKRQVAKDNNRRARNATVVPSEKGGYSVHKEQTGVKLDEEASANAIASAWKTQLPKRAQGETSPADAKTSTSTQTVNPIEVTLTLNTVTPKITEAALKNLNEISSFTTRFGGTGASRGGNIALATGKINGTLLAPGEVFSYNKVVGPRNERAGFRDAPVIVKGELVPGIGGGICQVSSTLYNAVLRSDLKIVSRSHHAFPVHYLPAGCDATVVDGAIDFKFQNSTDKPLYIASSSRGGRLTFRLLGEKKLGESVSIERTNLSTIPSESTETQEDPTLYRGRTRVKDRGHNGHRVTVYRVIKENGQVVKRELVSKDYYRPFPEIVLVGTKSRPVRRTVKPTVKKPSATSSVPPVTPPATNTPLQ